MGQVVVISILYGLCWLWLIPIHPLRVPEVLSWPLLFRYTYSLSSSFQTHPLNLSYFPCTMLRHAVPIPHDISLRLSGSAALLLRHMWDVGLLCDASCLSTHRNQANLILIPCFSVSVSLLLIRLLSPWELWVHTGVLLALIYAVSDLSLLGSVALDKVKPLEIKMTAFLSNISP